MSTVLSFNAGTTLETCECYRCGILFAMPGDFRRVRLQRQDSFWCPNGHEQHFTGKTEAQKERERRESVEREVARLDQRLAAERSSHAATKGQLTKTRKRVSGGVCPCCNRSFVNLARHMHGQHPGYADG